MRKVREPFEGELTPIHGLKKVLTFLKIYVKFKACL